MAKFLEYLLGEVFTDHIRTEESSGRLLEEIEDMKEIASGTAERVSANEGGGMPVPVEKPSTETLKPLYVLRKR